MTWFRSCSIASLVRHRLAELRAHRLFFLEERRLLGLDAIDPDDFALEFRLMTIQRGLKSHWNFFLSDSSVRARQLFTSTSSNPLFKLFCRPRNGSKDFQRCAEC